MPDERTLIVTGASSGIGRALALAAASAGYRVVMVARRAERLAEISRSIRGAGGACVDVAGDVAARDIPARIVHVAMQKYGRIDVVVNNAGGGAFAFLLDQSDAELEALWQVHVAAPLRLARAAVPHLQSTRGQLVFVGSGVARVPLPRSGGYPLVKAAIRAAAIQLRRELRPRAIGVTYVDPGVVATEFHSRLGVARPAMTVSPERVARAVLRGIARRRAVINAVPLQAAFAALTEWSGPLSEALIVSRFTPHVSEAKQTDAPYAAQTADVTRSDTQSADVNGNAARSNESKDGLDEPSASFEQALEPVARRMERVKLPASFLRDSLVPGSKLELGPLAMRWAGMPNKNERAALREALEALAAGGYLQYLEGETWTVVRAAD